MGKWGFGIVAALACAFASSSQAQTSLWGAAFRDSLVERFLVRPRTLQASLSPDGKYLARVVIVNDLSVTRVEIADLDKNVSWLLPLIRRGYDMGNAKDLAMWVVMPRNVTWVSDDLIAVNYTDEVGVVFAVKAAQSKLNFTRYCGTIRVDGETVPSVVYTTGKSLIFHRTRVDDWTEQPLKWPADKILDWRLDATGLIRIVRSVEGEETASPRLLTWYRKSETAAWQKLDERSALDDPFNPVSVTALPNRIVVQAHNGSDRMAVWNYDVDSHAFLDIVASQSDADIVPRPGDLPSDGLAAVVADGLVQRTVWFDGRMSRLQAAVDAALPGHVNDLHAGRSQRLLVRSSSDVDPGHLYVLDTQTLKMQDIEATLPTIVPAQMRPMQAIRYPSFDGLDIPAYLTLPAKPSNSAPLIVLIHGGPQARDRWHWDPEVQTLVAHGYAVFQPQFRGSTGFGRKLEEAGYGQWGLAMQDDITAGVHYLIDQGVADPKRICIIGASYGGYAALWGLAKTPDLYRCGVSTAGVSDIERLLTDDTDFSKNLQAREFNRSRIGDPSLMKATWDSVSPLKHADRIQAPLLLVHGDLDIRVPIAQSKLMFDAMETLHKDVDFLEFPQEGHNVFKPADQRRYYEAIFKLLKRTIGKGVPTPE